MLLFALSETGIGLFGIASPWLIPQVGDYFVQSSLPIIALANFILILIPTTLMGATLPVLVVHAFSSSRNVGVSVGTLYLFNTAGAATGAFLCAAILFVFMTVDQSIYLAAAGNFLAAGTALALSRGEVNR